MRTKKNIRTYLRATCQLLLGCVIIFNLVSNNFHEFKEHALSHESICSDENERDACHRYVYHHEQSQACNGSHEHFGAVEKDCFACNYFKERQHDTFLSLPKNEYCSSFVPVNYIHSESVTVLSDSWCSYLRGPPVLI